MGRPPRDTRALEFYGHDSLNMLLNFGIPTQKNGEFDMVKFKLRSNPHGQVYLPKEVREELGTEYEGIGNARAFVIYPKGTPPNEVLGALEVIQKDLHHRQELREKETIIKLAFTSIIWYY